MIITHKRSTSYTSPQTVPRVILLRKCRGMYGATSFLQLVKDEAGNENDDDHHEKTTHLAEARHQLCGLSFLCDRVPKKSGVCALPMVKIKEEGLNEVVVACVRHVIEGRLVTDAWREVLEMLGV